MQNGRMHTTAEEGLKIPCRADTRAVMHAICDKGVLSREEGKTGTDMGTEY